MRRQRVTIAKILPAILPPLLLMTSHWTAAAEQLFRWLDDKGQVHFSDTPPADARLPVEIQPVPVPATSGAPPADDRYSVINQAKQLEGERQQREQARAEETARQLERERLRAELEEARARARQAEQEANTAEKPVYVQPPYPGLPYPRPPLPRPQPVPAVPDQPPLEGNQRPAKADPSFLSSPNRALTRPRRSLEPAQ
jgi:hypothetical protein